MTIYNGDCLEVLRGLPDDSVDSVCTDPPYGLSKEPNISEVLTKWLAGEAYDHGHGGFMGKEWDSFVPHPDVWREVYRVLKPGGYALVFAGTRTQDLMTIALRLAGFEVRDVIEWLYFSGFPKSMDVGKAFDKKNGAFMEQRYELARHIKERRQAVGVTRKELDAHFGYSDGASHWERTDRHGNSVPSRNDWRVLKPWLSLSDSFDWLVERIEADREKVGESENGIAGGTKEHAGQSNAYGFNGSYDITAPATDQAKQWDGWGTQTKPAHEPVIVVHKPLTVQQVADKQIQEVAECLASFVKTAAALSTSSLRDYGEEYGFVHNRVEPTSCILDGLREVTDMSRLKELTENIDWSTALLCLSTLADRLKNGSTYTTETALSTITELRTLSYFRSLTTLERIIADVTKADGNGEAAQSAAERLNAELSNLYDILTPFVLANATLTESAAERSSRHEPIIVVRKPLIGTVADNVEKYGTGGINIDGCRIATEDKIPNVPQPKGGTGEIYGFKNGEGRNGDKFTQHDAGRFPANAITADDDAFYSPYFNVSPAEVSKKASKRDRNTTADGRVLDGTNAHPTVKPIDLMTWLIRLVTPPGGIVLDPFAGSGTTLVAAKREGFEFIGIEREAEYVEIIEARTKEPVTV